jgi:hypothetical protein
MDCHLCFSSSYRGKARILFVFSLLAFFLLFFSIKVNAGTWTSNGPEGGTIRALAIDPVTTATVYTGTGGGVFKTTDGGASWSPMNSGLTNTRVQALAIDPVTPATIYAGTYGGGVFKTTDGGANWLPMNSGLTNTNVNALAIDPVIPATIYAGTGYSPYFPSIGVFKSTDGGASWSPMNSGLTGTDVRALAIDPVTTATVYAGTYGDGVFKSTNAGASWSPMNSGLTNTIVQALAIDPLTPATIYAGTYGGGVFVYRETSTATTGDITIDHTWHTVNLSQTYMDPVIIVGSPTYHGCDPGVVRLRNVTNLGRWHFHLVRHRCLDRPCLQ